MRTPPPFPLYCAHLFERKEEFLRMAALKIDLCGENFFFLLFSAVRVYRGPPG